MTRFSFTQPVCDDCWDDEHPDHLSPRILQGEQETCCHCNAQTMSGIYIRADPSTLKFPTMTKDGG